MVRNNPQAKISYAEKLRDPRWQRVRLETMNRAHFKCEDCGSESRFLNIHHRIYVKGREPWDYPPENFVCCCEPCHIRREAIVERSRMMFQLCSPGLAEAFLKEFSLVKDPERLLLELHLYMKLHNDGHGRRDNG